MAKQTFYVYKECPSRKKAKKGETCKVNVSDVPCSIPASAKAIKTIKAKTAAEAREVYIKHKVSDV